MTASRPETAQETAVAPPLPALFQPITLKGVTLRNRLVNGPTSLFTCDGLDGMPTAFHMTHLGSHAIGGAGLVFTEAAAVSPEGRTCLEDLGCWSDAHGEVFAPIVRFAQSRGARVGLQLFHGGDAAPTARRTRPSNSPKAAGFPSLPARSRPAGATPHQSR